VPPFRSAARKTNTAIASVQGSRPKSPLLDQQVTIQGIVTLALHGEGMYVEEPESDSDTSTSNAIFVKTDHLPADIEPRSWISAHGTVTEIPKGRNSLTALTNVTEITLCSSGTALPFTNFPLPLNGFEREAFEGMRIRMNGSLTVSDTYQFARGGFSISGNGVQFVGTEVTAPGTQAYKYRQKNQNFSLAASLPEDAPGPALLTTGSSVSNVTGILVHDARNLRLALQSMDSEAPSAFTTPAHAGAGEIRVVGMNLLNFFNGDGKGGDFPTPRGAKTTEEFDEQSQRLGAAIGVLNPHVLAVMELENDGFGARSAAADFIALAEDATGGSWQVARPAGNDTGGDKITVGLFYRDDLLATVGSARTLTGPEFRKSRQPMAQVFKQRNSDGKVLVVVNHNAGRIS